MIPIEQLFSTAERIIYDIRGNKIAQLSEGELEFVYTIEESIINIIAQNILLMEGRLSDFFDNLMKYGEGKPIKIFDLLKWTPIEDISKVIEGDVPTEWIEQLQNVLKNNNISVGDLIDYVEDKINLDKYQVIRQLKEQLKKYEKRKKGKQLAGNIIETKLLVFSRNSEDVKTASTRRGWLSCINPSNPNYYFHKLSTPNTFIVYVIDRVKAVNDNKYKLLLREDKALDYAIGRLLINQTKEGWCPERIFYPVDMNEKFHGLGYGKIVDKFLGKNLNCKSAMVGIGYSDTKRPTGIYINVDWSIEKVLQLINKSQAHHWEALFAYARDTLKKPYHKSIEDKKKGKEIDKSIIENLPIEYASFILNKPYEFADIDEDIKEFAFDRINKSSYNASNYLYNMLISWSGFYDAEQKKKIAKKFYSFFLSLKEDAIMPQILEFLHRIMQRYRVPEELKEKISKKLDGVKYAHEYKNKIKALLK